MPHLSPEIEKLGIIFDYQRKSNVSISHANQDSDKCLWFLIPYIEQAHIGSRLAKIQACFSCCPCEWEGNQERRGENQQERKMRKKRAHSLDEGGSSADARLHYIGDDRGSVWEQQSKVGSWGRAAGRKVNGERKKERNGGARFQDNIWAHHIFWIFADWLICHPKGPKPLACQNPTLDMYDQSKVNWLRQGRQWAQARGGGNPRLRCIAVNYVSTQALW
jgi:hypothetical protein